MRCRICRVQIGPAEIREGEAHILTGMLYGERSGTPEAQANRGAVHQQCLNRCRILRETFDASFMIAFELLEERIKRCQEKIENLG